MTNDAEPARAEHDPVAPPPPEPSCHHVYNERAELPAKCLRCGAVTADL